VASREPRVDRRSLIPAKERDIKRGEQHQFQDEHYGYVAPEVGCHHDY
jgi:hypothetical protein